MPEPLHAKVLGRHGIDRGDATRCAEMVFDGTRAVLLGAIPRF